MRNVTIQKGIIKPSQLKVKLPPERNTWNLSFNLTAKPKTHNTDLAMCVIHDPVLIVEIMSKANTTMNRGDITTLDSAITRLGYDDLKMLLNQLIRNLPFNDVNLREIFDKSRQRGYNIGGVASIIAGIVVPGSSMKCRTIASCSTLGEMLAMANFQKEFMPLWKDSKGKKAKINYTLLKNFDFDSEVATIRYLRYKHISEKLIAIIDRSSDLTPTDAKLRTICFAAVEMVDAYENNKWAKYAPSEVLPPKSYLRLLNLYDFQYREIFERATSLLLERNHGPADEICLKELGEKIEQEAAAE